MDPTLASQMHIDIRSMRYFIALAREGSMSKAAVSLRVTQPTLSRQIGLLEQGSGKQLYALTYKGLQDIVGDPRVVSVPLDPPMVDQSVLIWKRRRSMSRACVAFLETLRSLLAEEDDQGI